MNADIASDILALTTARNSIRTKLEEKGVDASEHGFADFSSDIESISSDSFLIHTFTVPSKTKTYTFNYTPSATSYILIIRPKEDFSFQSDYACALQVYVIGNNSGYSWLLSHSSHKIGTGGFTATVSGGTIKLADNYANYFPGVEYNVYLIPVA